jgi:myo-inositol-1(or 4)-monophosphatase
MKIEKLVEVAKSSALIGGQVLKENFLKVARDRVEEKGEKDFVSYVDRESEARIREFITKSFPDHGIVGEEGGGDTEGEYVWFVDPLDGTKNYIAGFPIFGVSVAVSYRGEPVAGAVYLPYFDHLYWAGKGLGAFKNGRSIRVSGTSEVRLSVVAYGFPSRARRDLEVYWRIFREVFDRVAAMRRPGAAAVDLCFVAEGVFEGLLEFELHPWDVYAGAVILKEAGGSCRFIEGGGSKDVIASNGRIQNFLEGVVGRHLGAG